MTTAGREKWQFGPAKVDHFVFCDPCLGLEPVVVREPRAFFMGQVTVVAISLGLLGLLLILQSLN